MTEGPVSTADRTKLQRHRPRSGFNINPPGLYRDRLYSRTHLRPTQEHMCLQIEHERTIRLKVKGYPNEGVQLVAAQVPAS